MLIQKAEFVMQKILSTDLFKHMGKVTQLQVESLYRILNSGAKIEDLAGLLGYQAPKSDDEAKPISDFKLSELSLKRLEGVHPDLVAVVKRAIELSDVDFAVLEGVRTADQAYINWGKGRTVAQLRAKGVPTKYAQPHLPKVTWLSEPLNSKHIKGNAVDLAPLPIDWNNFKRFDQVAKAMKLASEELGVKVKWGADWDGDGIYREKGETDSPHFEI